tara:strand:+ start:65 stop:553 length:489 start_codon:yes stop_codon:yes gene_type:complete
MSNKKVAPHELHGLKKPTYYHYLKLGMPKEIKAAKKWREERESLQPGMTGGTGEITIGGRTYNAQDLMDLRGKVMEGQATNLDLKNRIEALNLAEKEGRLIESEQLTETLHKILVPLRKALDQMPENLATALNPDDPTRAETILAQELQNVYADLTANLGKK